MGVERDTRRVEGTRLESDPYRVAIPPAVLDRTPLSAGETVRLGLDASEGRPRFVCRPSDGHGVTRTLSARSGEATPGLTLPKAAVETGGFVGCSAVPYASGGQDTLAVGLAQSSGLSSVSLSAIETAYVSRLRQGDLAVTLSADVAGPLARAESLWVSLSHYGGQFFFVLDEQARAPPGAREIAANPNTGRETASGLTVHLPRTVGRLCGIGGATLRWGRAESDRRLLGTVGEA